MLLCGFAAHLSYHPRWTVYCSWVVMAWLFD